MNAPLFNLKCHSCGAVLESMIILLPGHSMPRRNEDEDWVTCEGSNTLARQFVDMCPACQIHGMKPDCSVCKGTHEVYTPITIEIEQRPRNTFDEWLSITLESVLQNFAQRCNNPDDAVSAIYAGEQITAGEFAYRIKPRTNQV